MEKLIKKLIQPSQGEIEEALKFPNGRVYLIHPDYSADGEVPPSAIIGAWKVDADGKIVGDLIHNPNYTEQ
ncbi:hypothetical protein ACT3QO_00285 [Psychrobacter sp. AOP7-D1-15]|uniref:hypothetical protein n=1 Tax=unclassified Psychrobacter TaxID=196806 RepID=UPI001D0227F4|nr:hypothetical protein [Psychrobacter sp. FME61]